MFLRIFEGFNCAHNANNGHVVLCPPYKLPAYLIRKKIKNNLPLSKFKMEYTSTGFNKIHKINKKINKNGRRY